METRTAPSLVEPPPPPRPRPRRRWRVAALATTAGLVALALVVTARDDTPDAEPAVTTTTTATPSTTSTSIAVEPVDEQLAAYPSTTSPERFGDPRDLVRAFALDLGFGEPVVGELRQGDARSGEIDLQPRPTGPVTTVLVRQLGAGDDWWVIGAGTAAIEVQEPSVLDAVTSPIALAGRSTAFEANVEVTAWQDGVDDPIGLGWVMGGANGEMGPFAGALDISPPVASFGTIVFATRSMEDGHVWEAAVLRVRFAAPTPCGPLPAPPAPGVDQMTVRIFLTCEAAADAPPVALTRSVRRTPGVLRASLLALLAGPTDAELDAGFVSWFSADTAGMLESVRIDADGDAIVDFADLRPVIPGASASAGSQLLLAQLDATVLQHPTVRTVTYRIAGDCEAFFEWLQLAGCEPHTRPA